MFNVSKKSIYFRYLYLTLSLLISAASYNLFIRNFNIVSGGSGGAAIIIEKVFGIDSAVTIFILCLLFAILGLFFLGYKESFAALYIAIIYPIFVYATSFLVGILKYNSNNVLIGIIFGGVISGISNGMIYQADFNTGGFGVLSKIFAKKFKISESLTTFLINGIIIFFGALVFGYKMVLYAIVMIYITAVVSNKVFIGVSSNKLFYIISSEYEEIKDIVLNDLKHDITIFDVKGEYLGKKRKMLMIVIPNREYFLLKGLIEEIDKDAFVFISDNYEAQKQDVFIRSV